MSLSTPECRIDEPGKAPRIVDIWNGSDWGGLENSIGWGNHGWGAFENIRGYTSSGMPSGTSGYTLSSVRGEVLATLPGSPGATVPVRIAFNRVGAWQYGYVYGSGLGSGSLWLRDVTAGTALLQISPTKPLTARARPSLRAPTGIGY